MFFTKSPMILKTSIEELEIRTNYLQTKKFTSEMISRILSKNPYWLLFRYIFLNVFVSEGF
jgi:mTERF domain-containing protein